MERTFQVGDIVYGRNDKYGSIFNGKCEVVERMDPKKYSGFDLKIKILECEDSEEIGTIWPVKSKYLTLAKPAELQIGDIICGTGNNILTGRALIKGEVTEILDDGYIKVKILEHEDDTFVGCIVIINLDNCRFLAHNIIVLYRKGNDMIALEKSSGKKAIIKGSSEKAFDLKVCSKAALALLMDETGVKISE